MQQSERNFPPDYDVLEKYFHWSLPTERERFSEVHHDLMATPVAQLDERARFWLERTEFSAVNLWKAIGSESVLDVLQEGRLMFQELAVQVIPSFLIDGRLLAGPVATTDIQNVIDQARDSFALGTSGS